MANKIHFQTMQMAILDLAESGDVTVSHSYCPLSYVSQKIDSVNLKNSQFLLSS